MKKQALTATEVKFMPTDPKKRYEVPAGPPTGLYLVVQRTGSKSWAFRYRFQGRPRKLTFKQGYPDLKLAKARAQANEAVEKLKDGIDPAAEPVEPPKANTYSVVVDEFIERYAKRNKTWAETKRLLEQETGDWKDRLITDIGKADVLRVLDKLTDRGAPIAANRTLAAFRKFFRWAAKDRGLIPESPIAGLGAPAKEQSRDRVLTDAELAEIWNAAETLGYPNREFFRLLILTAQRRGEVAGMRWQDLDLDGAAWILPKELTKAGRRHFIPLSQAALDLLESIRPFAGPYVLTTTDGSRPISGYSRAKQRLDDAIVAARKKAAAEAGQDPKQVEPMADWRVHDIRRTVTTGLAGMGTTPHVLAAILNHSIKRVQGITAVYNRFEYADEKRKALEAWAAHVLGLMQPEEQREAV